MHGVILSIGSNIEPEKNCAEVIAILKQETCFKAKSKLIETEPWGFSHQANFLNGAVWLETDLQYEKFNAYLKAVEKRLDRVKTKNKAGPRTIDLDIIVWDGEIIDDDYYQKSYVHIPVNELIRGHGLCVTGADLNLIAKEET